LNGDLTIFDKKIQNSDFVKLLIFCMFKKIVKLKVDLMTFDQKRQNYDFVKLLIFHIFKKNRQIEGRFDDF